MDKSKRWILVVKVKISPPINKMIYNSNPIKAVSEEEAKSKFWAQIQRAKSNKNDYTIVSARKIE